jgi:hypothetical protein
MTFHHFKTAAELNCKKLIHTHTLIGFSYSNNGVKNHG